MLRHLIEPVSQPVLFHFQVVLALEAHPELRGVAKEAREQQRRFCRDGSLPVDDRVYPASVHADSLRQPILRDTQGTEEFLHKDFTGMNGR